MLPVPEEVAAQGLVVVHDFASTTEEAALLREADERLRSKPYETEHYDSIITGFRECAVESFANADAAEAVRRMRLLAWQTTAGAPRRGTRLFPHAQLIDIEPQGCISAHRDNMHLVRSLPIARAWPQSVVACHVTYTAELHLSSSVSSLLV